MIFQKEKNGTLVKNYFSLERRAGPSTVYSILKIREQFGNTS